MQKIALITDSASDISKEARERYNIRVLPFKIIYKDKEFSDGIDITAEYVYQTIDNGAPTSSLPSMKDIEKMFEEIKKEGYTHAIVSCLSTGLSGVHNAVVLASENHPEIKTFVYDSKSISYAEALPIIESAKMIEKGMTFEEIVKELPNVTEKIELFFVVGTLEYLKRGGRIGKVSGTIAEMLNIKPIISVDKSGVYYTRDKVRGRKQSLSKMVELGNQKLDKKKNDIYIVHGEAEEEARKLIEQFEKHPNANSVTFCGILSPVSGVHTGPGLIGVIFHEVE
ncbi:DegV family protein [Clostridium sp.]|uniref:DegV family protein n=1 Tax=Clostridium sp. TaxID=1506 RepID=UPI002FCB4AC0